MSINGHVLLASPLKDFALGQLAQVRQVALDSHNKRKEAARREWERQKAEAEIRQAYKDRERMLAKGGR